jgi:hypothetical protein
MVTQALMVTQATQVIVKDGDLRLINSRYVEIAFIIAKVN